jgi:hypothetical protein
MVGFLCSFGEIMRTLADELDVHILEIENPLTHP